MAERVWEVAGPTVRRMLRENSGYELILTGHSLGAGAACLLNVLCHSNGRKLVDGRKVRCFAYAAPPTYAPLDLIPAAANSCTSFIHERDVVPFLSVDSVRHALAKVRALAGLGMKWRQRVAYVAGFVDPDKSMLEAVSQADRQRLPPKAGAPTLAIPAKVNLWLREKEDGSGKYDFKVCDSKKLAELGIQLDVSMVLDHPPPRYEHAFDNLE